MEIILNQLKTYLFTVVFLLLIFNMIVIHLKKTILSYTPFFCSFYIKYAYILSHLAFLTIKFLVMQD